MAFNPAQNPLLNDFQGGQMTDLPAYPGTLDLTSLMEIVTPGTAAAGVNYAINMTQLAALIANARSVPTILTSGSTYASVATDTRILVNLTVPGPMTITLLGAASYPQAVLVKDLNGNASPTNPLTTVFTGGETMDGLSTVAITNPYGWFWFNPLSTGNFYET